MANLSSWRLNQIKNFWAFALSLTRSHYDTARLAISTKSWLLFPPPHLKCNFLDSFRECSWSPNARTQDPNSPEVLLHCIGCIARLVSTIQIWRRLRSQSDVTCTLSCGKKLLCVSEPSVIFQALSNSGQLAFQWYLLRFSFWDTDLPWLVYLTAAMASSPSLTTIPLHEPVFQQFLHDVHHAYLLLHRAMSLLPPTLIPNIEPTPLPSTGVWDQPPGFPTKPMPTLTLPRCLHRT